MRTALPHLISILRNTFRRDGTASTGAPNETCAACGQPFHCGASLRGCWCTTVSLTSAQRATLRAAHDAKRCLCRPCLERAASGSMP
jgi:hypothetical protein